MFELLGLKRSKQDHGYAKLAKLECNFSLFFGYSKKLSINDFTELLNECVKL